MLCHDTLVNHYKTNFLLHKNYGYSLTELDNMIPYEREIYIGMLLQHLEKQRQEK